jgi:hypothetical protein
MTPDIKDKLKKEMDEICNIMFVAQSSLKIVDYLRRTREGMEIEVVRHSMFFKYTANVHWQMYVTEMSKLFRDGKNEYFNIHKFIRKFKDAGEYHTHLITDNSIQIWESNLSLEKEKTLIENLVRQRDGKYSHKDKDWEAIKNSFTFIDAKEFLNIVKRMLSEIYGKVFDTSMIMDPFNEPVDDLKRIVKSLAAEYNRNIEMFEKINKEYNTDKDNIPKWYEKS